ncbi:hypothetical protein ACFOGJ_16110 [Marinibaculum pumilum]|uniref:DUF2383 domain-containing protein n=1 Tax=Marinibaculum pumilum TaxID=1766165 RepID=A0ABV7L2J1_9PROT
MTKIRPCGSRFEAIDRAAAALGGYDAAAAVIGKSHGYLRDAGDQDRDTVELKVWEMVDLEAAAVAAGQPGHFLAMMQAVHASARASAEPAGTVDAFVAASGTWGRICDELDRALHPDGEAGPEISAGEAARLLALLTDHDSVAARLRQTLVSKINKGRR